MSFWQSLSAYVGTSNAPLKHIQLQGRLQGELSNSNYQGPVLLSAVVHSRAVHIWEANALYDATAPGSYRPADNAYVYWLPWLQNNVTQVSMATLNSSGCDYFLTSEFSGCRFVVADDRLQHIAWGAGPGKEVWEKTSDNRDIAQYASWWPHPPLRARTYSYSELPNPLPRESGGIVVDGYGAQNWNGSMNSQVRATVIGRKVLGQWHFYMQRWIAGSTNASFVKIGI